MATCVDFIKSIGYSNFTESVTTFFDENMALFNLVGECDGIEVIEGEVKESSIKFNILFKTVEAANKMYNILLNRTLCIFGLKFTVEEIINGSTITVEFV